MKVDSDNLISIFTTLGVIILCGLFYTISESATKYKTDTREGTLACNGAKSIIVKDVIYCKKGEEENEE